MNKLFSTALLVACTLGIRITEHEHSTGDAANCDWNEAVGVFYEHYAGKDGYLNAAMGALAAKEAG